MSKIRWDEQELLALARETAAGLHRAKMGSVPSLAGNNQFLVPILQEAMAVALKDGRRRSITLGAGVLGKRFWPLVPDLLEKLEQNGNGHAPAAPAEPPPPPPPEKTLADFTDAEILTNFFGRILKAIGTRQEIHIPGMEETLRTVRETSEAVHQSVLRHHDLENKVSNMGNQLLVLKQELSKFKPPPPSVFVLGATQDTQKFLRNKCDEAHLEIDFRFMEAAATARAFKADYVLQFGQIGSDWERHVQLAVPKSHICFIGGRHDAAMVQLKDWLK